MSHSIAADIVIPVFNEGPNIRSVLDSLKAVDVPDPCLICYDFDEDNTLTALKDYDPRPLQMIVRAQPEPRSTCCRAQRICRIGCAVRRHVSRRRRLQRRAD